MSKQAVTLLLAYLVSNYLAFQAGQTILYYKSGSPPSVRESRGNGQQSTRVYGVNQVLRFAPSRVDFGTITGSEPQNRTVSFHNPSQEEVVIKRVKASCGCTSAVLTGNKIPPGGKGEMVLVVDPTRASTDLGISVSVEYEGTPKIDRLLISGQVIK